MSDPSELTSKLERSNEWVRDQFGYLDDLASGLGCARVIEGGPGAAYVWQGRKIAHVHPKRRRVGIGLPDAMRADVAELTGLLRGQRGLAWFNWEPGAVDRDTIALLFELSLDAAKKLHPERGPVLDAEPRAPGLDDEADLALVLAVVRAFAAHERSTGRSSSLKPLRETVFFRWEGPRLPPGRTRAPTLPHSPAARAQRQEGGLKGLVYEHVAPISGILRRLLDELPADTAGLRRALDASADRVIITVDEDRALTRAGYRDTAPDAGDPWSRYAAIDLDRFDFAPYKPGP